jgi:FecR protein
VKRLIPIPTLCVALLAGACAGSSGGGELRVVPQGDVFVVHGSDESRITGPEGLAPGDTVRTGPDARAFVQFPDGQAVELAPTSTLGIGGPDSAELGQGKALVHAPSGMSLTSGSAEIRGEGEYFRLDRYVGALRIGVYEGSASVEGWDGRVSSLEEVGVSAGIVPQPPRPLALDPEDPWDGRILGDAMQVGDRLADIVRGLDRQLQSGTRLDAVTHVLPGDFPIRGSQPYLERFRVAEALVAAMVAFQAARLDDLSTLSVLGQVARLRSAEASWAIVVARWNLVRDRVLSALAQVIDLVAGLLVPGIGSVGPDAASATAGGAGPTGGPANAPPSSGSGSDEPPPPPGSGGDPEPPGGGPTPPPPPPPECGSQLECAVEDVLGGPEGPLGGNVPDLGIG